MNTKSTFKRFPESITAPALPHLGSTVTASLAAAFVVVPQSIAPATAQQTYDQIQASIQRIYQLAWTAAVRQQAALRFQRLAQLSLN